MGVNLSNKTNFFENFKGNESLLIDPLFLARNDRLILDCMTQDRFLAIISG